MKGWIIKQCYEKYAELYQNKYMCTINISELVRLLYTDRLIEDHDRIISVLSNLKWTLMDINSERFINYSFDGICCDIYDRLDYEARAKDETVRILETYGAMIEVICI